MNSAPPRMGNIAIKGGSVYAEREVGVPPPTEACRNARQTMR